MKFSCRCRASGVYILRIVRSRKITISSHRRIVDTQRELSIVGEPRSRSSRSLQTTTATTATTKMTGSGRRAGRPRQVRRRNVFAEKSYPAIESRGQRRAYRLAERTKSLPRDREREQTKRASARTQRGKTRWNLGSSRGDEPSSRHVDLSLVGRRPTTTITRSATYTSRDNPRGSRQRLFSLHVRRDRATSPDKMATILTIGTAVY